MPMCSHSPISMLATMTTTRVQPPCSWKNIQRLEGAKQELKSVVEETLSTEFEVENPITHAWGVIEVNQHATAVERLLSDQISGLSERLDRTERAYKTLSQNVVVIPSSAGALPSATGGVIYPASITITQPSSGTITQSSSGSVTAFPEGGLLGGFGQTSETPLPMREEERRKDD